MKQHTIAQDMPPTDKFLHRKRIFVGSDKEIFFLREAWQEGMVFFRQQLKNGMYEGFMHHKEVHYVNTYTNTWCMAITGNKGHVETLKLSIIQSFNLLLALSQRLHSVVYQ
jgi:hypothetical protein